MQETTMYKTTDGQVFDELADAQAHEAHLANEVRVEKFLDANYPLAVEGAKQGPARSMAKKAVEQFLDGGF
jgi:hypothetical protein